LYFPKRINICEVGPRDGLQNEDIILKASEKAELINMCIDAGYREIEIGSFVHPKAVPALADTEEVFKLINYNKNIDLRALVTNKKGVERAIIAGVEKIKLTVSASNSHNISNFNKNTEKTIKDFKECYQLAKENNLFVSGAISTSFGCPFDGKIGIEKLDKIVINLIGIGILEISLSDTTGMANPKEVYSKCKYFKEKYPEVKWNLHFHNTRDMGMMNILAAMQAGMENFDTAFSGLGGCPFAPGASGNVC